MSSENPLETILLEGMVLYYEAKVASHFFGRVFYRFEITLCSQLSNSLCQHSLGQGGTSGGTRPPDYAWKYSTG